MKANELRIGNLVNTLMGQAIGQKDMCIVDVNHLKHISDGNDFGYIPIPLTEEWLLNLGFEKDNNYTWFNQQMEVMEREQGFYIWLGKDMLLTEVHQLQNLYFALTGEELELKTK